MVISANNCPGIAIIGCGLVGQKRLNNLPVGSVKMVCDLDITRAENLARLSPGCLFTDSVEEAVTFLTSKL